MLKARIQDLVTLGMIIFSVALFSPTHLTITNRIIIGCFGLVMCVGSYVLIYLGQNQTGLLPEKVGNYLKANKPVYPKVRELILGFTIWGFTAATLYSVIKSLTIPLKFHDVWVLISIQLPFQLLPIQGLGNAGNHEAGWVGGMKLLGVELEQAMSFALSSHVLLILFVLLLGVFALLCPSRNNHLDR
ncbi:MAG: hypothetical protein D6B25_12215 [Desulfobulbaceae bacterium]|nr:MAG: hypothetical protein D6B25_12215 [Desulfobulbaceae bacterium]